MLAGATLRSKLARKLTYKKLIVLLSACTIVVIVAGVLTGLDYLNYKHAGRSHFFGTLNTYKQDQTLHLYNLDLRVTEVKVTPYDEAKLVADEQNCINNILAKPVWTGSGIRPIGYRSIFSNTSECESEYKPEYNASAFAQKYQQIVVGFYYENKSNQSLDFNNGNFQLLANTGLENEWKCPLQTEHVIKGSGLGSCVVGDISKSYSGPLNLEINLYGKTKRIVLPIPR